MHTKPEVKTTPGDRFSGEGGSQYLVDSGDGDGGGGGGGGAGDLARWEDWQLELFRFFLSPSGVVH